MFLFVFFFSVESRTAYHSGAPEYIPVLSGHLLLNRWFCVKCFVDLNKTGVLQETGTAYPSGAPEFTPGLFMGSCYSIFSFMCMLCRSSCCAFSFGHCVVCSSSIYTF
jgi:hypothetical protein